MDDPCSQAEGGAPSRALGARDPKLLERLERIADATLGYMSLEEMLSELLERIRGALAVDTAAVLLLDEDRKMLVARAARGLEEEVRQGVQVPLARGFAGRVAATGEPIILADLSRAEVVNPILRQRGIRSMLGVPVHVEGRVIGVMHVGTVHRRDFTEDDVEVLQLAADRAALAIDNASLSEQRAATQIIQRTLLPDALPDVPGVRFSAKYLPAGSAIRIGGDWYDSFQLANGRLALVIGDVVGRGVLAASVMAEIRTALRAYLLEGHELGDVMSLLNDLLVSLGRNRTATAAILELDLESGAIDAVSAGHLPALIVDPDGRASFVEQLQGLPLGVVSSAEYTRQRHPFPTGSVLLLYTDGLIERRGEAIDRGLERLCHAAERAAEGDDSSFADRVYRTLVKTPGLEDDVALLAVETLPLGPTLDLEFDTDTVVLGGLRRTLGRWLITQGADSEELFGVTLAASEAAANAVEHAYGAQEDKFTVHCERDGSDVLITIRDSGRWRERRPYGRGRGLAIIRAMVDRASVERTEDGTVVTLVKRLSRPAS